MTAVSPAQRLAALPPDQRAELLSGLDAVTLAALPHHWPLWARPDQLPPGGDWRVWLILAGRGWGKTRTVAEWLRAEIESGRRRNVGIIGPTADSVRRVMIEGPSGLLATADPGFRPDYESSTRRIRWPNGATGYLFSAEEPDRLRGPNFDCAICDELAAWANAQDTWDNLQLALRIPGSKGDAPRCVIATTPKPMPLLKDILAAPGTVTTRGRTIDNRANLDAATLKFLENRYGGTTLGRQELDGELIEDADGALWSRSMIEAGRVRRAPELNRIVVAIDPAGSSGRDGAETGIVVAGIAADEHIYIIEDASGRYSPDGWARRAVEAYHHHKADRIVAESNFGGAMVEATLRSVARNVPVTMVHASRGKQLRAEPIVALYEQRRVHHVGHLMALEEQLVSWVPNSGMPSPDRLDALVWCVTQLSLDGGGCGFTVQRLLC